AARVYHAHNDQDEKTNDDRRKRPGCNEPDTTPAKSVQIVRCKNRRPGNHRFPIVPEETHPIPDSANCEWPAGESQQLQSKHLSDQNASEVMQQDNQLIRNKDQERKWDKIRGLRFYRCCAFTLEQEPQSPAKHQKNQRRECDRSSPP